MGCKQLFGNLCHRDFKGNLIPKISTNMGCSCWSVTFVTEILKGTLISKISTNMGCSSWAVTFGAEILTGTLIPKRYQLIWVLAVGQ
jgi:hypothetical protein